MIQNLDFQVGDKVVYPSHGVGEITMIESQSIAGIKVELYIILFSYDKMTLKVPVKRASASGLRHLVDKSEVSKIYNILSARAKSGNKMWSRRAQEYDVKINSGDILLLAEVVRDLYKNVDSDRSYSERKIYEVAVGRLAGELAILEEKSKDFVINKIVDLLKEKVIAA